MLQFLAGPILGTLIAACLILNTLLVFGPLMLLTLVKVLVPVPAVRRVLGRWLVVIAETWTRVNTAAMARLTRMEWEFRGFEVLSPTGRYMVIANHQTWNDIQVLFTSLIGRIPFLRFFLKQQLIWVPLLGPAWWALDFPFMKRYSAEAIARNPALKGTDMATTRRACEKFRTQPVSVLNFLEGTRLTAAKHARQKSPYRNLLRPRAGGLAFALAAMGDVLDGLLDVTIYYPEGPQTFWAYLSGRVRRVVVDVRLRPVPVDAITGNYEDDPVFRKAFQDYVGQLWADKDERLDQLARETGGVAPLAGLARHAAAP